jgi:ADP-dependent NAD(P)H-hydrate dehydratase / NAD(P)H-hydrate epimerase
LHKPDLVMKIFTSDKIRAADKYTIELEPIASVMLMERAAEQLAEWCNSKIPKISPVKIFTGPGNNGGDGWALARLLIRRGYANIKVYPLKIADNISHDAEINRKRLLKESQVEVLNIESEKDFPRIHEDDFVIDALFGSGLSRQLEGLADELVKYINQSRKKAIIAVDIPSGLFPEDNSENNTDSIIKADFTLSFQFPKLSFFFAENEKYVGEWSILPIGLHPDFIMNEPTIFNYLEEEEVAGLIKERVRYSHKGTYGHALLIAGSYGMMGAAVIGAKAALRAGAGLITTHIPKSGVEILQTSVPESLISIDPSETLFSKHPVLDKYTAIGVGPAIGTDELTRKALTELLGISKSPVVIDADAINILSQIKNGIDSIPSGCILTPHPKEFERLFGNFSDSYTRLMAQMEFSRKKNCTIIFKGAHSCITTPDGNVFINSTGNPGMATGGSGDVLTGLILGLLAQGYIPELAAIIGVYIHGKAGDEYTKTRGQHSLIASDLIDNIGSVFNVLEKKKTTK